MSKASSRGDPLIVGEPGTVETTMEKSTINSPPFSAASPRRRALAFLLPHPPTRAGEVALGYDDAGLESPGPAGFNAGDERGGAAAQRRGRRGPKQSHYSKGREGLDHEVIRLSL